MLSEEARHKGHNTYHFTYIKCQNQQIHRDRKEISDYQNYGERRIRNEY